MAIDEFLGTWIVKVSDTRVIRKGDRLQIAPSGSTNQVSLVWTATTGQELQGSGIFEEDLDIIKTSGVTLRGESMEGQLSLFAKAQSQYRAIYGVTVVGDPEEAGVWGAESEPD